MLSVRRIRWMVLIGLIGLLLGVVSSSPAFGQEARKVKYQVKPVYPELAVKMHLAGSVKVEVVITPAGIVKSTKVLGGHPVLAGAAEDAAKRWKFEPGPSETTETLVFDFKPKE